MENFRATKPVDQLQEQNLLGSRWKTASLMPAAHINLLRRIRLQD
jgi:hypothetical protein